MKFLSQTYQIEVFFILERSSRSALTKYTITSKIHVSTANNLFGVTGLHVSTCLGVIFRPIIQLSPRCCLDTGIPIFTIE